MQLEKHFSELMACDLFQKEKRLPEQSHEAYLADRETQQLAARQAEALNGMVVSDSESEDPDAYLDLDMASERAHVLVMKWRKSI